MATKTRARANEQKRRGNPVFTVLGTVLLLVGLTGLGYVAWEYFGTNITAQKSMDEKATDLREQWKAEPPAEPAPDAEAPDRIPGDAIALLRVPRFGADYEVPILTGTDVDTLAKGVGWYDSSVHPGEIGNFALAGHRITHGEPFAKALELQPGDEIIVETREATYTYVMDTSPADLTVVDTDTWVLDPVPGKPDQTPTEPIITITTCQDLFHSVDRSIGFGHLAHTEQKS